MKLVHLDGKFIDANTGDDLTELIAAYKKVEARIAAGTIGGAAKSTAKKRAARLNGKKGGRPKGSKNKVK